MQGRLNIFQEAMLHWNDLHPYNAVHVVRIPITFDLERVSSAVHESLSAFGISRIQLDRAARRFEFKDSEEKAEIKILPEQTDVQSALTAEITRQINTAFDWQKPFCPFRFFVAKDGDGFSLGLSYFHAVADAEAIVRLLSRIAMTCAGLKSDKRFEAIQLYPNRSDSLLSRRPGLLFRKFLALPGQIENLRSSARLRFADANNSRVGFEMFSIPSEQLAALIRTAKSWNVTVNDLLLALLLRSVSSVLPPRNPGAKRSKLSAGCIVNARADAAPQSENVFGLFLGSFNVTHEARPENSLQEIATDVRNQTAVIKERKLYLAATVDLSLARRVLSFYSTERRRKLYQRHHPLCGGVTNMNLNPIWQMPGPAWDYFRAVSTGPVTPLVLSFTTAGERANVGLSFRETVFSAADTGKFQTHFRELISTLETPK